MDGQSFAFRLFRQDLDREVREVARASIHWWKDWHGSSESIIVDMVGASVPISFSTLSLIDSLPLPTPLLPPMPVD